MEKQLNVVMTKRNKVMLLKHKEFKAKAKFYIFNLHMSIHVTFTLNRLTLLFVLKEFITFVRKYTKLIPKFRINFHVGLTVEILISRIKKFYLK